jgi:triacylglycerol lipase
VTGRSGMAHTGGMWSAMAPARRRLLTVVAALVVVGLTLAVVGFLRGRSAPAPVAQGELGPVVLLSGYGGNVDVLEPVAATLRDEGRRVEVFPPLGDNTGDLREQADAFDRYVDGLTGDAGSIDVVGYSAGGLVARLWAREHDGAGRARRVVTVGSPHHGTGVSALATEAGGCPRACEQMRPDSDLLRRLNAGDETPPGPRWVTVRTEDDQTVTPSRSADLEGALNITVQQLCPEATTSHGQLPSSPATLAVLKEALGPRPPQAPSAQDVQCRS